jgi:hypothetical protein
MELAPQRLDDHTSVIYLNVPGRKVVQLQAYFESCEGLGIVRTLDIRTSKVCILTTPAMLSDCAALLDSILGEVAWTPDTPPEGLGPERFLGYFKREGRLC